MNAVLRINIEQQMNVIRHYFHADYFDLDFLTNLNNQLLKSIINAIDQNFSPVLWTPNYVVFTRIDNIMIRFVFHRLYYTTST